MEMIAESRSSDHKHEVISTSSSFSFPAEDSVHIDNPMKVISETKALTTTTMNTIFLYSVDDPFKGVTIG